VPGVFWLGSCVPVPTRETELHGYNSCYLVCGERESMLVETGCPQELDTTMEQLAGLLRAMRHGAATAFYRLP
jgi:hypothetical protein